MIENSFVFFDINGKELISPLPGIHTSGDVGPVARIEASPSQEVYSTSFCVVFVYLWVVRPDSAHLYARDVWLKVKVTFPLLFRYRRIV